MAERTAVMEYKCPCCTAGLPFDPNLQKLKCQYCDNEFDLETVKAFNEEEAREAAEEFLEDPTPARQWSEEEQENLNLFTCPSCGGEILAESTTAATFCPYCANPTILPSRLSGGVKPDWVIPFATTREDAQAAFRKLCKGKPLLPSLFTQEQQVEKITGLYVPFWLYDCGADIHASYKATRVHNWSDANYIYTRTEHFLLRREAEARFTGIPMDGSSKMDDTFMESIEPYDYSALKDFDTAYLTGFLADKYDVPQEQGHDRVKERVGRSMDDRIQSTLIGYSTAIPTAKSTNIRNSRANYALMPVWILNTRYNGQLYTFAMNGQTGRMTGRFPICPKKSALWFSGICAAVTALCTVVQLLMN